MLTTVAPASMAACEHLEEICRIGAAGVFGVELDVVGVLAGQLDGVHRHLQNLDLLLAQRLAVPLVPEFAADVDIRRADAGVDARPAGLGQGLAAGFDIGGHGARQGADRRALDLLRDALDGLEIFGRRGGIAGLDHVHVQPRQLRGDRELLPASQAGSGGLLAVAQGGVEYRYFFGHPSVFCITLRGAHAPNPFSHQRPTARRWMPFHCWSPPHPPRRSRAERRGWRCSPGRGPETCSAGRRRSQEPSRRLPCRYGRCGGAAQARAVQAHVYRRLIVDDDGTVLQVPLLQSNTGTAVCVVWPFWMRMASAAAVWWMRPVRIGRAPRCSP